MQSRARLGLQETQAFSKKKKIGFRNRLLLKREHVTVFLLILDARLICVARFQFMAGNPSTEFKAEPLSGYVTKKASA